MSVKGSGRLLSYINMYNLFDGRQYIMLFSLQFVLAGPFVSRGEIWRFQITGWRNLAEAPRLIFTTQSRWSVPSSMSRTSCKGKKPSRWKNINTHTHTHTHTHTQTQTLKALGDMNHLDNRRTLLYSGTQHSGTWYTLFNRLQGVPFTGILSMFTKFPDYCHWMLSYKKLLQCHIFSNYV